MSDEITGLVTHLGDTIQQLWDWVLFVWNRFSGNLQASFTDMTAKRWLRVVIVVCTYLLIRPHIMKFGQKQQEKQWAKQEEDAKAKAKISPNALRGNVDHDSDDEESSKADPATTATEWGKKARKRQRAMVKKIIEAEEKRLQETFDEREDKDIEEFLTQ